MTTIAQRHRRMGEQTDRRLVAIPRSLQHVAVKTQQQDNVRTNTESVQCRDFSKEPISRPNIPRSRLTLHWRHRSCNHLINPICHFLWVLCSNRGCISSCFRDNGPRTIWGHDLDLPGSRDVIDQLTNRIAICRFLLFVHWYQVSISKGFRDIRPFDPKNPCAHRHTDTRRKWFYILFHAMYCIWQTKI